MLYSRSGQPLIQNSTSAKGQPVRIRDRPCWRCGGAGGAEKWAHTGWRCYRCDGKGIDPVRETVRLFTAEQLEKLNARKAKADEKRAAKKAEAARIEAERVQREQQEVLTANSDFLSRIDAELAHGEIEILRSIRDQIAELAREPSERQIEVVNRIIERNAAERKRLAGAAHVGKIKERREFDLTLLYTRSTQTGKFPTLYSHWSLFLDEEGRKIACKSPPHTIGLKMTTPEGGTYDDRCYAKGQKVKVKATVVEHAVDKKNGEPVTYINRPKAL